jgi:hypothetical protein
MLQPNGNHVWVSPTTMFALTAISNRLGISVTDALALIVEKCIELECYVPPRRRGRPPMGKAKKKGVKGRP